LFHNSNIFRSCVIHISYTGCAKIKKIIPAPKAFHLDGKYLEADFEQIAVHFQKSAEGKQ